MKVDIFPSLDLPVVYVAQPYGGMDPSQMEGLIANYYEYHFLYINGIHHVESKNVQGVSLMKLYFHPGTDMAQAMAETVGYVNRSRAFMPPGTVPPFIMRFDTGSVPVGYLVLSSETKTVGEIQDQALFKVRPMFASMPGVSAPPPFGGNQRTIVVRVDPDRLRELQPSPDDVVAALSAGNTDQPVRQRPHQRPDAARAEQRDGRQAGGVGQHPRQAGRLPARRICATSRSDRGRHRHPHRLRPRQRQARRLYPGHQAGRRLDAGRGQRRARRTAEDAGGAARRHRGAASSSTSRPTSPTPCGASPSRACWAAVLVGLMVLLFLRDWRSVIVVVLNIPLALLGSRRRPVALTGKRST